MGWLRSDEGLLAEALDAPDRDMRVIAEGLGYEMRGEHSEAAAILAAALDVPNEGYFDLVILDALARNRAALARNRAAIGDRAGVEVACRQIERPVTYHPYREPALAACRILAERP